MITLNNIINDDINIDTDNLLVESVVVYGTIYGISYHNIFDNIENICLCYDKITYIYELSLLHPDNKSDEQYSTLTYMSLFIAYIFSEKYDKANKCIEWLCHNYGEYKLYSFIGDMVLGLYDMHNYDTNNFYKKPKHKTYSYLSDIFYEYIYSSKLFTFERCVENMNYESSGWRDPNNAYVQKHGLDNIIKKVNKYRQFVGRIYLSEDYIVYENAYCTLNIDKYYNVKSLEEYDDLEKNINNLFCGCHKIFHVEFRTTEEHEYIINCIENDDILKLNIEYD